MSADKGQFADQKGRSRGTNPTTGEQNPLAHVPLGMSPSTPNQPESTTIIFPGQEHPRAATPDVYHQEDANQTNRRLTPETAGIVVKQQSGPVKWKDRRVEK